jgi:hypothetical protein
MSASNSSEEFRSFLPRSRRFGLPRSPLHPRAACGNFLRFKENEHFHPVEEKQLQWLWLKKQRPK